MNFYKIAHAVKKPFRSACLWGDHKFYDPQRLKITSELENSYPAIRIEVDKMMERYDDFVPFQHMSPDQTYISNDDRWKMFFLKVAGFKFKKNAEQFPVLMRILEKHKYVVSAYLSVLGPEKALNPHEGPWAGVLRMHMGIIIPDNTKCHINIEGDKYYWDEGKVVLFDDTYNHYAVNETDKLRVILFLDIMRPMTWAYNAFNWFMLKACFLMPYVWVPLWRHRQWSKKFYGGKNEQREIDSTVKSA